MKTGPSRKRNVGAWPRHLVEHGQADDVGRHQIRCELDAGELHVERSCEGLGEEGLGDARDPFEQNVSVHEQCSDHAAEHTLLTDDHLADLFSDLHHRSTGIGIDRRWSGRSRRRGRWRGRREAGSG